MKEVRIDNVSVIDVPVGYLEFYIKQLLRDGGLDLSQPIIRFDDFEKDQTVYRQESQINHGI